MTSYKAGDRPQVDKHASDNLIAALKADTASLIHDVDESKIMRMGQERKFPRVFGPDAPALMLPASLCGKEVENFIRQLDERDAAAAAEAAAAAAAAAEACLLYTSPSPRDRSLSRMPSSA